MDTIASNPVTTSAGRISIRLTISLTGTILLFTGAVMSCVWRPDSLAALTLIPPWCWFLGGLISQFPAWCGSRKRLAKIVTIVWCVFAIGWVEELPSLARTLIINHQTALAPGAHSVRIVSLNCASEIRCVADLQRMNPDVVLLQEAPGDEGLEKMAKQLFGQAGSFLAGGDTAILARGRIEPLFVDRSSHFVGGVVHFADGGELTCFSLRLAPPPSRLDFWSLGFRQEHRELRTQHRRQLSQIMALARDIPSSSGFVVGGDFNTTPLDRALDELRPHLSDVFNRTGIGWGATGTNDWPLFRVDQVWCNSRLLPLRSFAETTVHSDHRMVVCDLEVPE